MEPRRSIFWGESPVQVGRSEDSYFREEESDFTVRGHHSENSYFRKEESDFTGSLTLKTESLQALPPNLNSGGKHPELSYWNKSRDFLPHNLHTGEHLELSFEPMNSSLILRNLNTGGEHPKHSDWNKSPDFQLPNFCTGEHQELGCVSMRKRSKKGPLDFWRRRSRAQL